MNNFSKTIIGLLLSAFAVGVQAQIRGEEIRVVVSPDHESWQYKLKEKCTYTIGVYKAENLMKDVSIDYELGPEWYPTEKKENVRLDDGRLTLTGKLDTPGFLRCKVKAHVDGRTYEGLATTAYQPNDIKAYSQYPADFDTFWQQTLDEARQTPLDATMELMAERCTDKVNVYKVSFQNVRHGSRTFGILCMPKAPGRHPALLRVPGAGVRPYTGDVALAEKGAITLEIGIHGVPVDMPQSVYDDLAQGPLYNYQYANDDSRNNNYYRRVVASAIRSVDFICSLPQFDGTTIGVTGSSQGGALSVMTAALDSRVTFFAAIHPALCDHRAHLSNVAGGWPHYFFYFPNPTKERMASADYYDTVNFATRLNAKGWFSWGYNDEVCPPTSMYAAYNAVTAPKELHLYLETGHFWYQEQYEEWNNWLCQQLGVE